MSSIELLADTRWQQFDPKWRLPRALCLELGPHQRVSAVRVQQLRTRGAMARLSTRWWTSDLFFAGRPLRLAPPRLDALSRRLQLSAGVAVGVSLLGLAAVVRYLLRSPWFGEYGHASGLSFIALIAGALAGFAALGGALPGRPTWRLFVPATGLILMLLSGLGLARSAQPTLVTAERAFNHGDLDRAEFELDALVAIDEDSPALATLRTRVAGRRGALADAQRQRELDHKASFASVGDGLRVDWHDPLRYASLRSRHLGIARARMLRAWDRRDETTMRETLVGIHKLDEPLEATVRELTQLLATRAALETLDFARALKHFTARAPSPDNTKRSAKVHAELCEALARAVHEQHTLGGADHTPLRERVAALDASLEFNDHLIALECPHSELPDAAQTRERRERLSQKLRAKQAREVEAEARRSAAKLRKEQTRREKKNSHRGLSGGSNSGGSNNAGGWSNSGGTCCKHCRNSQPCGNSCISWSKNCHQGPGCAC